MGTKRGAISTFPSPDLLYKKTVTSCILSEEQEFDRHRDKPLSNTHAELKGIWKGELLICKLSNNFVSAALKFPKTIVCLNKERKGTIRSSLHSSDMRGCVSK